MSQRVNAFFLLFEEGIREDELLSRLRELAGDEGEEFIAQLRIYAQNIVEDEAIPEDIVDDDDGVYARMRSHGKEYASRLEHLLSRFLEPEA